MKAQKAGPHHQHRLGARPRADAAAEFLRRGEGRGRQPYPLDGARTRAVRDPGQRHRAGLDGDRRLEAAGSTTPSSEELDLHARLMSHIPLGRPATTQEIAQRRALPGRAGKLLHHRPHPADRRRLDRRLRAGFLRWTTRHAPSPRASRDLRNAPAPARGPRRAEAMVASLPRDGAAAEIRACGADRLPQGRDAGLPAPLHRPGGDRRRRLRASAARATGSPRPIAATATRWPRAWTRAC